jgi:hypothetical protein
LLSILMTFALATVAFPQSAAAELSGRWEFGVRDGKVRDVSKHRRHLDLMGAWSRADGRGDSSAVRFRSTSVARARAHRSLDPGRRAFAVSVVFQPGDRVFDGTDSPNIVQKGRYNSAGQWKLQLIARDGGRVQCRMKGTDGAVLVTSTVSRVVADDRWHKASCARRDRAVVVVVDGVRTVRRVSVGRVASAAPLSVANKSPAAASDQLRGRVDSLAIAQGKGALQRTLRATRR